MKIHGHPASGCTCRVLTVLAEKGVAAQLVVVDLLKGEQKQPAHLAFQPFGKVPALEDDGFVLFESQAIMRYLDATLPGASLVPADAKGRALMDQWLSADPSYFGAHGWQLRLNLLLAPMKGMQGDRAAVDGARKEIGAGLDVVERALVKRPYLAGTYSLADISFMPFLQLLADSKQDDLVHTRPAVAGWWDRLRTRTSWQRVLEATR